jgi:hypothetical protein
LSFIDFHKQIFNVTRKIYIIQSHLLYFIPALTHPYMTASKCKVQYTTCFLQAFTLNNNFFFGRKVLELNGMNGKLSLAFYRDTECWGRRRRKWKIGYMKNPSREREKSFMAKAYFEWEKCFQRFSVIKSMKMWIFSSEFL